MTPGGPAARRLWETDVIRPACAAMALWLVAAAAGLAQGQAIDDLKGKIFDAKMTQQTFAGLKFCDELDGKHFYFQPRGRVLDLEDYHRSLESLTRQHVYNPEKRRPWTDEDAAERWEQVKQEALKDKANCDLVASLPDLEKQLDALEKKPQASEKKN